MTWYLYILECADGSLYTGITKDIAARVRKHNDGKGALYTRFHRPVRCVYSEPFTTHGDALRREAYIKRWTLEKKRALISGDIPRRESRRRSGPSASFDRNSSLLVQDCGVVPLQAPLVTPFRIATGQHDTLDNLLFYIRLDGGVTGYGEAAVATHITGENLAGTEADLRAAAGGLKGEDLGDYASLIERFRPLFKEGHAGLAAFEMAVLDALTRACGIPLWRLFGERSVRLATDITIVIGSVAEAKKAAAAYYKKGFRTFKVKVGRDRDADAERVMAVAGAAPQGGIILDGNQGYTAGETLQLLKALKKRKIVPVLLEQPVAREDVEGLARLTRESGCLVCADESARSLGDVVRLARAQAVGAVNIKFMKTGIREAWEIARFARAHGLKLMIGAMMESALAITASAHFAAGFGGIDFVDLDTTYFIKGELSRSPALDAHGRFNLLPVNAGIGVRVPLSGQGR